MEEQNLRVLGALFLNKDFRTAMDNDIDEAIKNEDLNPDEEFIQKLKEYRSNKNFSDIENSTVNEVNESLNSDVGLEARW